MSDFYHCESSHDLFTILFMSKYNFYWFFLQKLYVLYSNKKTYYIFVALIESIQFKFSKMSAASRARYDHK